ncbi:LuxR C-terminal-related transcriptional regulator [Amycolatopsis pithecellobii]|uniref:GAF domain-containing protein n=1 Tax=Amycolatopsis pithecellobii TaxID=664692 RepID=A0A6N7Z473_9PSEU|nr:LuxR C-terminal-related transcriptional regulator [Amycolatopsis pithecellobii]MTD55181.1 GAF domain-containing protein [Amycolatopsis pithecellobii]
MAGTVSGETARRIQAALVRIRERSGVSLAYAGELNQDHKIVLNRFDGPVAGPLRTATLEIGYGLGGQVVARRRPVTVDDYFRTTDITHHYDRIIRAEGLRAVSGVPVIVGRRVVAVLYGALRTTGSIDDRGQEVLADEARALEQDLVVPARRGHGERDDAAELRARIRAAHLRLRMVASRIGSPEVRDELDAAVAELVGPVPPPAIPVGRLTGRELDVLGLIAAGRTNPAVAATLGLTTHTVKSYVKSAMRKLGAETRLEAVVLARRTGQLP